MARRRYYQTQCGWWGLGEAALAVTIVLGFGLVLALLYRLGLWPLVPVILVVGAFALAWAVYGWPSSRTPPPPPVEPRMRRRPGPPAPDPRPRSQAWWSDRR